MKRILCILAVGLLTVCIMPLTAFGVSSYGVDKVDISVDLRSDGTALVSEEWTVTVEKDCEKCFSRNIVISQDNFEYIDGISDLSVSLDGNVCMEEKGDVLTSGTYFYTKTDDMHCVNWYIPEEGQHVFSLRYIQSDAVKLYKNRAYYYFSAVEESNNLICRNMTIKINTPEDCFAENFEIVESGSLAGEKADGSVKFFASNTAGGVKTGVSMPSDIFGGALTVIVDDNRVQTAVTVVVCVILVLIAGFGVFFALKYKTLLRSYREKKCKKKIIDEPFEKLQRRIFLETDPARMLNTVLASVPDESDYFTVTALELYQRGYIIASAEGFDSSDKSMTDHIGRKLNKNEKRVIRLFDNSRWKELVSSPLMFYNEITQFNKNVGYLSPLNEFTAKGRKLIRRCFELKLNAKRTEYVSPQEISDSFFKSTKYTTGDLVAAIINEYEQRASGEYPSQETDSFVHNLFMFRDVYGRGRELFEKQEAERKQAKEKR